MPERRKLLRCGPKKPLRRGQAYMPHNQLPAPRNGPLASPKVVGRARSLLILEEVLSRQGNQVLMAEALQAELEGNPTWFFRTYVLPFIPKESRVQLTGALPVEIRIRGPGGDVVDVG